MKDKKRILFVTHTFHKKPYTTRESHSITLLALKKELEKQGHYVRILQTKKMFPKVKGKFDIVHGFSSASIKAIRTWYIGQQLNAKTIHSIKSISPHFLGGYKFPKLLNLLDYVTVPLECIKREFIKKGVKLDKIGVLNSNIDLKKFKPKKVKKLKYLQGKYMVFYWGALWEQKGVEDIIDAAELQPNVNFVIIPRNDIFWEVGNYDKAQKLKNVFFLKSSSNIPKHLNMCDAVLLPYRTLTRTEANPSCLLEAMACGKPVLTTRLEGLFELVGNNVHYCQPECPKDIADSLDILNVDDHYARELGERAFEFVKKFGIVHITDMLEFYYKLL